MITERNELGHCFDADGKRVCPQVRVMKAKQTLDKKVLTLISVSADARALQKPSVAAQQARTSYCLPEVSYT